MVLTEDSQNHQKKNRESGVPVDYGNGVDAVKGFPILFICRATKLVALFSGKHHHLAAVGRTRKIKRGFLEAFQKDAASSVGIPNCFGIKVARLLKVANDCLYFFEKDRK